MTMDGTILLNQSEVLAAIEKARDAARETADGVKRGASRLLRKGSEEVLEDERLSPPSLSARS